MFRLPLGTLVLLSGLAAFPAQAADPPQDSTKKVESSKQADEAKGQSKQRGDVHSVTVPAPMRRDAPAGGMTVFIDPATGQIRQPDASDAGNPVISTNPPPKAPEPVPMQGPGGAVGVKLGPESMSYMVLTIAPDGKDTIDCVTGEKAANAALAAAPKAHTNEAQSREVLNHPQETHSHDLKQDSKTPQDTRNVKNQR